MNFWVYYFNVEKILTSELAKSLIDEDYNNLSNIIESSLRNTVRKTIKIDKKNAVKKDSIAESFI